MPRRPNTSYFDDVDLARLSTPTRVKLGTIWLAKEAGFTQSEIAAELGVSHQAVSRRLSRAFAEVKRQRQGDRPCVVCGTAIPWTARSHKRTCGVTCRVALHRREQRRQHAP